MFTSLWIRFTLNCTSSMRRVFSTKPSNQVFRSYNSNPPTEHFRTVAKLRIKFSVWLTLEFIKLNSIFKMRTYSLKTISSSSSAISTLNLSELKTFLLRLNPELFTRFPANTIFTSWASIATELLPIDQTFLRRLLTITTISTMPWTDHLVPSLSREERIWQPKAKSMPKTREILSLCSMLRRISWEDLLMKRILRLFSLRYLVTKSIESLRRNSMSKARKKDFNLRRNLPQLALILPLRINMTRRALRCKSMETVLI